MTSTIDWRYVACHFVLLCCAATGAYAQQTFSDDRHWDPRFGPPALFANAYNIEVTDELVLVSGLKYGEGASEPAFGTVYCTHDCQSPIDLEIPGMDSESIFAGNKRIFAKLGGHVRLAAAGAYPSNYPNPFTNSTTVTFGLQHFGAIRLEVFDLLGRPVATIVDDLLAPGQHEAAFNPDQLAGGVYIFRLTVDETRIARPFIVLGR